MRPLLLAFLLMAPAWGQDITLPNRPDSMRFAVIGDSGTGGGEQYELARIMAQYRQAFPFELVIMLGDNLYGRERPRDYEKKFEIPYKPLLESGVKFYASLGNHDDANQVNYKLFNMNGQRFYTFKPKADVRFFALDSNYMDRKQLEWLEKELKGSDSKWKIAFLHHPIYSSGGRHGSDLELRKVLEPLFLKYGVDAAFAGHEHFYERLKPQQGVAYFISGAAGKLRRGNIRSTGMTAKGYDQDRSFMLIEIAGDALHFQAINRKGETVDSGAYQQVRRPAAQVTSSGS